MALPLTPAEEAAFAAYRANPNRLTAAQRRRGYALAYRRFLTVRYCTKASPRLWRISEAAATGIRRDLDGR